MNIAGKHVVISGGGSGVGAELARCFADQGARISILGRRVEPLQEVAAETGALALACDVTDRQSLDQALEKAAAEHGAVAIALANAGAAPSKPFDRMTPQDFTAALTASRVFFRSSPGIRSKR